MGKPYARKHGDFSTGKPDTFTCNKCGQQFNFKPDVKKHWRESADHDKRRIK